MGKLTFDMILVLAGKGYTVSFRKNTEYPAPLQVIAIKLVKGEYMYDYSIDITHHSITGLTTDGLIAKALQRAMVEIEYEERKNTDAEN